MKDGRELASTILRGPHDVLVEAGMPKRLLTATIGENLIPYIEWTTNG